MSTCQFHVNFIPPDDLPLKERKRITKKRKATLEQVVEEFRKALYRWESSEGMITSWTETCVRAENSESTE